MANISDSQRKRRLLKALPADGTPIGNQSLAQSLGWALPLYFKIRDELLPEGKIQLGRGRGGSVRLSKPVRKGKARRPKRVRGGKKNIAPARNERRLYPGFLKSLETWAAAQGWTERIVQQTSEQGTRPTGGRYTRPDFVVIGMKKYDYTPGVVRDVETFEVKALGAKIDSVFEAAAHSRAATKSYLVLQVDENSPTEDELARFEGECQRFGVGLITFKTPGKYEKWEYLVDPVREEPDPELLEQFIRDQVKVKNQELIRKWVR